MRSINIPQTDLAPSVICLGGTSIGSTIAPPASFELLDAYLAHGGNFLDTAAVYANWLPGESSISEKTIGRWMQLRRNRDRVILATKGAHPDLKSMHLPRLSRADIVHDLDQSLRNLQTDTIDIYWLHRDDPQRPVAEIVETLADQVKVGKIRYFGCSNWRTERIRSALAYSHSQNLPGFIANQVMWSLAVTSPNTPRDPTVVVMDDELKQYHLQSGLAALAYSSQANGWFHRRHQGTVDRMSQNIQEMYSNPTNERRYQRVKHLAAETGLSITAIVLGYLLAQPFPTIPLVGCQNVKQLHDSLNAADVTLDPEQVKYLEA